MFCLKQFCSSFYFSDFSNLLKCLVVPNLQCLQMKARPMRSPSDNFLFMDLFLQPMWQRLELPHLLHLPFQSCCSQLFLIHKRDCPVLHPSVMPGIFCSILWLFSFKKRTFCVHPSGRRFWSLLAFVPNSMSSRQPWESHDFAYFIAAASIIKRLKQDPAKKGNQWRTQLGGLAATERCSRT